MVIIPELTARRLLIETKVRYAIPVPAMVTNRPPRLMGREMVESDDIGIGHFDLTSSSVLRGLPNLLY